MQVSLYFDERVLRRVDRAAKKQRRSRSKVIEALVQAGLDAPSGGLDELVGAWRDDRSAEEIVAEIYRDRRRNRRSER